MVNFKFYNPSEIFNDNEDPNAGMTGRANFALLKSFLHSRDGDHEEHNCNAASDVRRCNNFGRNAGSAALFKVESGKISEFQIPGLRKEYHFVSYGNKEFKKHTKKSEGMAASAYGHSEKILMRDILDDLISADPADQPAVPRPSSGEVEEYEVLLKLTEKASEYKKYLSDKQIIVKMWSERPACRDEPNKNVCGMKCREFLEAICPEGSQFGYIVENYAAPTNTDNREEEQAKAMEEVKKAFEAFRMAYSAYQEKSSIVAQEDLSSDDILAVTYQ